MPLALLAATTAAAPALAQSSESLVLNADRISRIGPLRAAARRPHWISYSDCVSDEVISFPITPSTNAYTLEVWVGTSDCVALRSSTNDRQQCWLVASDSSPDRQRYSIEVPVRNVVAKRTNLTDTPPADLPESVCRESTETNGQSLTYYFMLVGGGVPQASTTWGGGSGAAVSGQASTGFDVVGPAPPDSISVGLGEGDLSIEISDPGENSDRTQFQAFCVNPNDIPLVSSDPFDAGTGLAGIEDSGVLVDGGFASDAGADESTVVGTLASSAETDAGITVRCGQSLLQPGERPPLLPQFECGEAGTSARTIRTSRLTNGQTYAVAVAGEDLLGNVGALSNVECAAPVPLEDFYEAYRRQGGLGGGGFCSMNPRSNGREVPWQSMSAILLLLGAARLRRAKA